MAVMPFPQEVGLVAGTSRVGARVAARSRRVAVGPRGEWEMQPGEQVNVSRGSVRLAVAERRVCAARRDPQGAAEVVLVVEPR